MVRLTTLVMRLEPPVPPTSSHATLFGAEPGVVKGPPGANLLDPPVALDDPLYDLRDKSLPATLAHIAAENAYADETLFNSASWRRQHRRVLRRLLARAPPPPLLWTPGAAGYEFASRTDASRGPFPLHLRRRVATPEAAPTELLDTNAAPALLDSPYAGGARYLGAVRGVSSLVHSPGGGAVAYSVDFSGDEQYQLVVLRTPDEGEGSAAASARASAQETAAAIDAPLAWGRDDGELFYATLDATGRPHRLHRHAVGRPAAEQPPPIFEERDARFRLSFRRAADGSRLLLSLESRDASEVWALPFDADEATSAAAAAAAGGGARGAKKRKGGGKARGGGFGGGGFGGESGGGAAAGPSASAARAEWATGYAVGGWHCLGRREAGLQYRAACAGAATSIANRAGDGVAAPEGVLRSLDAAAAAAGEGRAAWQRVPGVDDFVAGRTLLELQAFEKHVAVEGRHDGSSAVFTYRREDGGIADAGDEDALRRVDLEGQLRGDAAAAALADGQWSVGLAMASEQEAYASESVRLELSTPLSPPAIVELRPATGELTTLWRAPPPPGLDPSRYVCERRWADAADGVRVPISVLYRRDAADAAADAAAPRLPTLLYGYGSYGEPTDPGWDAERLALVDCGAVHAIAHVRGGGELGAHWHASGRRREKANSFDDLVACAEALVGGGLADGGALGLEGRSAGGLLVGAAAARRPDLFKAVLASVPFLDPAGTLQDGSLPLTSNEWEEFGNPNEVGAHDDILGFSPLHRVPPGARMPRCLLLPALNDARTGFWEALKFAHAIRTNGRAPEEQAEVLVRMDMEGGHFRPSNPRERARGRSRELAFVLSTLMSDAE